jgi:HEAT repeats
MLRAIASCGLIIILVASCAEDDSSSSVTELLGDESPHVRLAMVRTLRKLSDDHARLVPVLIDLLAEEDLQLVDEAARQLLLIGWPLARDAVPALEKAMARVGAGLDPRSSFLHEALHNLGEPGVRGVLLDPDGEPLVDMHLLFRVHATRLLFDGCGTGPGGKFMIPVPPGTVVDVEFGGRSVLETASSVPFEAFAGDVVCPTSGLELRCVREQPRNGRLVIQVLDPDGEPTPGVEVGLMGRYHLLRFPGRTDPNGRLEWTHLPPYPMTVYVWNSEPQQQSPGPLTASLRPWVCPEHATFDPNGQTVTLRFRRGAALVATLLDPDGSPAVGVRATLLLDGQIANQGWSQAGGRLRLIGLPGRKHSLSLSKLTAGSFFAADVDGVETGQEDLRISLEEATYRETMKKAILRWRRPAKNR